MQSKLKVYKNMNQKFNDGRWSRRIDVADFVYNNITPYEGDASFLKGATERTKKLWDKCLEAIEEERRMFQSVKDKATYVIDTTFLTSSELKNKVQDYFSLSNKPVFTISFISFGYKHGVPMDADCMLDVRFLPNPFWEVELRPYSGDDECVYNYVMDKPETKEFCARMISFLDFAFYSSYPEFHLS